MTDFAGRKIFITGGSSGIGKQLAIDFLKLGAHVTIIADQREKLVRAHAELQAIAPSVEMAVCDVADLQQVTQTAETYVERFGAPDVLINNAGYAVYRTVEEMTVDEVDRLLRVNLTGACLLTRAFLPSMITARRGHVVMVASIAGRLPLTPCGPYGAAKHGMVAFAEILRPEVDRFGLTVHVICPGRVEETDFFEHETFKLRTPRRETRLLTTLEAISRATFTALAKNRFMTYVPRSFGFLVWLNQAFPFIVGPALRRLMRARVESVYAQKQFRDQP